MKERICVILINALWLMAGHSLADETRNTNLDADERLKLTLSKIAPLERWSSTWSELGPRICFGFFRPDPELAGRLAKVVSNFKGHSKWIIAGAGCLEPLGGRTFKPRAVPSTVAKPIRPSLTANEAVSDLMRLSVVIEKELLLAGVNPSVFSQELLTREGLRSSHAPFQDFADEGNAAVVFLIVNPAPKGRFEPRNEDVLLHFAPSTREIAAILSDILGVDLTHDHGRSLTSQEAEHIKQRFPLFWEVSDQFEDSYLSPTQTRLLYDECKALDTIISSQKALRGLDKLSRIAYWASQKGYGVLFSAP